ncbi:hypothetical protein FNV43_RR02762 [Rhamnella rubrinervis]|uniref:Uncharacterized protein n=1 Tax=Rhamnella rubrinervis TaxID=2594499 RepID=A0A8K0MND8_9ROSA|nr:hypothetical protein FNV43_RR02762 [Rhamnella rubrinervis]
MHDVGSKAIMKSPSSPHKVHPHKQSSSGFALMEQGGDGQGKRDQMVVQVHADDDDHGGDFSLLALRLSAGGNGMYDKPLSCFGCGVGWFSFLLGFAFPPLWYYATVLYFGNYYLKDPRERPGLAASAIAVSFNLLCHSLGYPACRFLSAPWLITSISHKTWRSSSRNSAIALEALFNE